MPKHAHSKLTDPAFAGSVSPYRRSCLRWICFALPSHHAEAPRRSLPSPRLISHSSHSFRLLPRPSGITSSGTTDAFYCAYMSDQNLRGTIADVRVNTGQAVKNGKQGTGSVQVLARRRRSGGA